MIHVKAKISSSCLRNFLTFVMQLIFFEVPLSSFPLRCTFEDGTDCFLKDDKKFDDFDWHVYHVRAIKCYNLSQVSAFTSFCLQLR